MPTTALSTAQAIGIGFPFAASGFYFCSSFVAVPNLYSLPNTTSTPIFRNIFLTGSKAIVPLVAIPAVANAYLAYSAQKSGSHIAGGENGNAGLLYGASAVGILFPVIFTVAVMKKGINRLVTIGEAGAAEQEKVSRAAVRGLLEAWVAQNYVRAGVSLAAGVLSAVATLY